MSEKPRRGKPGPKPYMSKSKEELIEIIRRLKRRKDSIERYLRSELRQQAAICDNLRGLARDRGEERDRLWEKLRTIGRPPADTKPKITRTGNVIHLHQSHKR